MTSGTLLFRQIHPSWIVNGRASSQAFRPTPKDHHLLSVYDGDIISGEDAWLHFTGTLGRSSVGVMAVSVAECRSEELDVRSDPATFPQHAVIDFGERGPTAATRTGQVLRAAAQTRGWLYQAPA